MSATLTFNFANRPLIPYAHDYQHGDTEPAHHHDCAQLIHSLTGVVKVKTAEGHWVVPPGRGVWMPAGVRHALQITGKVAARTLFIDPLARLAKGESVLRVALDMGYESHSAFSAMFRRVLGVPPSDYFPAKGN